MESQIRKPTLITFPRYWVVTGAIIMNLLVFLSTLSAVGASLISRDFKNIIQALILIFPQTLLLIPLCLFYQFPIGVTQLPDSIILRFPYKNVSLRMEEIIQVKKVRIFLSTYLYIKTSKQWYYPWRSFYIGSNRDISTFQNMLDKLSQKNPSH